MLVAERDVKMFLHYKFVLILRALWFLAQIALFGLIVNRMVKEEVQVLSGGNYFYFYAAGIVVTLLYSMTVFIGYDIYEEADHGVTEYLLSLPISRRELVLGRAVGGGLRSFLYVAPLMFVVLLLIGITDPFRILIALTALFLFAFGVAGMSITIAMSIKSHDRFDILLGVLNAFIVRLSTTMYPLAFMPPQYASIARFNPLTFAGDIFRWGAGLEAVFLTSPFISIFGIVVFFSVFTFLGIVFYEKKLEGGGWR